MQKIILCLVIVSGLFVASGCAGSRGTAPESVQQILKLRGYNFDEKSFFAAAQARDLQAINAFIDAGINPNAQDSDGRTVLISAAARGELDVVNTLLARGVDINVKDKNGYTALSHAIEAMHDEVEDALLNRPEFDPNCRGRNSRPALFAYVWLITRIEFKNCSRMVRTLVRRMPTAIQRCTARQRPATLKSCACCLIKVRTRTPKTSREVRR